jgi:hypothetical protein
MRNLREYAHPALMIATPVLLVVGVAVLWRAVSVEAHLTAFIIFALAGCSFFGARELKRRVPNAGRQASPDYIERKEPQ